MAPHSDSDTSSESEYDSSPDSTSEIDENCNYENLEPEHDAEEFENAPWNPTTQLRAT